MSLFQKHDLIELPEGGQYQAICVDEDTAVFAPIVLTVEGGTSTTYSNMFAFSNFPGMLPKDAYKKIEVGDLK